MQKEKDSRLTYNMENNLNRKNLSNYCRRFSKEIIDDFYKTHSVISGEEILELTSIKQVNLFVIKNLFKEWQKETGKLESKYFDYKNDQVRLALKDFMNILSKHISIDKKDFVPLLEKSTEEAILLIFSPYDYYTHMMDQTPGGLSVDELKRTSKYVKVNKNLLSLFIEKVEKEELKSLNKEVFLKLLNYVFENTQESPEDIESYLIKFSSTVPLQESDIYGLSEPENNVKAVPNENNERTVLFELEGSDSSSTLNDQLVDESKPTLADVHLNKKIDSIKSSLSINQRFMFTNSLFGGDDTVFNEAIEYLDNCSNRAEAFDYIKNNYSEWDTESEEVSEFMELLDKKF